MGKAGPRRRPALEVVREGNPGKRSTADLHSGVKLEPSAPPEPDWRQWFPAVRVPAKSTLEKRHTLASVEATLTHIADPKRRVGLAKARRAWLIRTERETAERMRDENARAREVARREWRRTVPILDAKGLIASVDGTVLVDHCIVVARIDQCERDISRNGIWVAGERGAVKNPCTTALNQLRTQLRWTCGEFGLSPVARDSIGGREEGGDEDSPFD